MNYTQTLEFLFSSMPSFQEKGVCAYKPGLERVTSFSRHLGNPQRNYFTIHVAGTNGKGSVSHMLASILQQAGYRTGLFTSPHLKDFRERIRVDGQMISKQKVVNFVDKHREKMVELGLSFFEMTAALAFDYFAQSDCEVVVVETGLGGRLDATNIILPVVSVVTNVGMEHTDLLGDTLQKIAAEKAGIIKKSIPLVLGESNEEYNSIFEEVASANKSRVIYAEQSFRLDERHHEGNKQHIEISRLRDEYKYCFDLDLEGDYQWHNVVTACTVADYLHEETPLTISRRAFIDGISNVISETSLCGRWQTIQTEPRIICDTGHNAHGLKWVTEQLKGLECKKLYCVIGFVKDKNIDEILPMFPSEAHYIFTQAGIERALDAEVLAAKAAEYGLQGEVVRDVSKALEQAKTLASTEDAIFVGGSTFVVAEIL
ncbi:MAG: bifunctional folylpolyglutamate synthase/dihydrofolate synthase [Alistipes sp.]|nr:bifunctional folylpolyglutamate synthase/dihydrofolate synthase [Alistipes sp.]